MSLPRALRPIILGFLLCQWFAHQILPCLASYSTSSPPNSIIIAYPSSNVSVGQRITLGWGGGVADISHNYLGLSWNVSVAIRWPNGTQNSYSTTSGPCAAGPLANPPSTSPLVSVWTGNPTTETGLHVALWNVTYGTLPNITPDNATHCNATEPQSYQTWELGVSFNVVDSGNSLARVPLANATQTLPSTPTGSFLLSNSGDGRAAGVILLMLSVLCCTAWLTV